MRIGARSKEMPKMPENFHKEETIFNGKENSGNRNKNASTWLCSDSYISTRLVKESLHDKSSSLWDQKKDKTILCKEEILNYKSKSSHRFPSCRPSTAVKRHVKKISEDFTITQIKYKNGTKPNGIIIQIESPNVKNKEDKNLSGALNTIFSPKIKTKKLIRKETFCSKCSSSKCEVTPLVTFPPTPSTHSSSSTLPVSKAEQTPSNTSSKELSRPDPLSYSAAVAQTMAKQRKMQMERYSSVRLIRKRKSLSANAGFANGIFKVPFEQVKKSKIFTEQAVKEGKVFAIHGAFPAIREALLKRGWVEKVLHTIPYVNPHPQNCVCTHVGWHIHPTGQFHHSSQNNCSTDDGSSSNLNFNSESSSPKTTEDSKESFTNDISNATSEVGTETESSINASDFSNETVKVDSLKEDVLDVSSTIPEVNESQENLISNYVRLNNYINSLHSQTSSNCDNEVSETIVTNKSENIDNHTSSEYIHNLTKTLNTSFLGPSEIREGIHKSINQKNLSIFQYSIPPYEKKIASPKDFVKPDSIQESEDKEHVNNESEINENLKTDANENEEDKEYEEENATENEVSVKPYNPYPQLDYTLTNLDKPVVARVLRNVEPNFIWSWNRDSISFKHLSKEQLVNRFPNTPFTTKFGLCETLQQLHWFSEAACVDTFVPRGYCIGHEDERSAFIHDYRTTACLNIIKWITEESALKGLHTVAHPMGEVPVRRIRQSLQHVERFIQSCCHDDLDTPPLSPLKEHEWDLILNAHYRIIHQEKRVKALPHHAETLLKDCQSALARVEPFWPQLDMDGIRNVWIVKPGAQSRGRGIFLLNHLEEILALVQSPLIYQTKYVVQKYMERPLLIYNTKFDIRQWFLVTDWNPLTVWMYKESYLRFCSQQYDLTNNDESIHLSNNAIQCKYSNGERNKELPDENMWDCNQFKEYLKTQGKDGAYEDIYLGMKEALIATMLAAQVQMDSFKHGFEFFGADFMLTQDLRPWLIEINSSPCMASTTSVTKRMCFESLNDTIKVVVDYRQNKTADTGKFELIYQDKEKSVASLPYYGVTLQVVGRQIWKPISKQDKRRNKKIRPLPKVVKSIPLVTLQLEESGDIIPAKNCHSLLNCQNYSQIGPTLTTIVSSSSVQKNLTTLDSSSKPNDTEEYKSPIS